MGCLLNSVRAILADGSFFCGLLAWLYVLLSNEGKPLQDSVTRYPWSVPTAFILQEPGRWVGWRWLLVGIGML